MESFKRSPDRPFHGSTSMLKRLCAIACVGAAFAGAGWLSYRLGYATDAPAAATSLPADADRASRRLAEPITPIPQPADVLSKKVLLGERLFHDPGLSRDQKVSCATCHDLKRGGVDGKPHSVGVGGTPLAVNTPTVFNSGLNFRQFWDGRAASLEDQAEGPLLHPDEMGATWPAIVAKLKDSAEYSRAFDDVYADGVQAANVKDAIASFERSLATPGSRFDRYLAGDAMALSAPEYRGYWLFKSYGCIACHQGANVGGNMFQKLGVMRNYFEDRGNVQPADLGRYNVTKKEEDRHVFKVPSLRNVALTAPYFHDGSAATLPGAVAIMGRYQLGVEIASSDIALIVAFLETLTGPSREPAR
jgi:cytochrome c peroxidase